MINIADTVNLIDDGSELHYGAVQAVLHIN